MAVTAADPMAPHTVDTDPAAVARATFVQAQTRPKPPPLVPELRLYEADAVTPLWEATEASLAREGLPPPFWAFPWAGGQALARHVLDHPDLVAGRRVLDLAAGGGIAGLAAARAGAAAVTLNDIDPFAEAAQRLNAALNGLVVRCDRGDRIGDALTDVDVVLAGDICYERALSARLAAWLHGFARGGTLVLMGDPDRTYRPRDGVTALETYDVPVPMDLEDRTVRRTTVWRFVG